MYRPHKFPFPANWPGKEIKRIFERMLSEGGEYFSLKEIIWGGLIGKSKQNAYNMGDTEWKFKESKISRTIV